MNSLLVIFRTVHYASAVLLLGELMFMLFVAMPAAYRHGADGAGEGARRFRKVTRWCLVAAIVSGVGWLLTASTLMSSLPIGDALSGRTIGLILGNTVFGQVFALRAGLLLALVAVLVILNSASTDSRRLHLRYIALVLAAAYLGSLAGVGHAIAGDEGGDFTRVAADVVHLLAAGAWLGALPALACLLGPAHMPQEAASVLRRFSTLGVICVGSLMLSGVVNSWYEVGTFPALVGTDYGRLLVAKLVLFMTMLAFATVNRGLSMQLASKEDGAALSQVRRNAMFEVALGVGVIAIAAALGVVVPAVHEPIVWPFDYTLSFDHLRQSAWMQLGVVAAGATACIAAIALLAGVLARPQSFRVAAASGFVAALAVYISLLVVPAHPTTYLDSPLPYSAEAIAAGSSLYMELCSACHGGDGRGNASAAGPGAKAQLDLNQITPQRRAGDLFWSIAHGIPAKSMPGFGAQLEEADMWSLVQFLDAQTAAQNALTLSDRLKPVKPVPAPEFTFEFPHKFPVGPQESLRQQRGKRIPLLVFYTLPASLPRLRELAALESAYTQAGAVIIAMPMNASPGATSRDLHAGGGSILAFTSSAVAATYTMFAREQTDGPAAAVQHVEYLVDRFGLIRARGIGAPEARSKWSVRMLHQIAVLVNEPPRPPIRWGHRH
jgi:putative copper export protein/mono/diheme cytochrome c family protein